MGMLVIGKEESILCFNDKKNEKELSTGKILEENVFSLLSNRQWETHSPFSRKIT